MSHLRLLLPEAVLSALALSLFLGDLWAPLRRGRTLYHLGALACLVGLGLVALGFLDPAYQGRGTLWVSDPLSLFFKVLVLAAAALSLLLSADYAGEEMAGGHLGAFSGLVLLSVVGLMLLVSSADLLLAFLSLELVSVASFILAGFERKSPKSSEGAIKYFLIGALSSAVMVYGISLYYGAAGGTGLLASPPRPSAVYSLSIFLILVGFGFKASIAPFHLWVPDAYEGAPTPITAFLSVAPKVAALGAMLRVFGHLSPSGGLETLFAALAALTMTVGNLTAIFQTNVKRLLAYSSIAQAGYMLVGFAAAGALGTNGVLLYALVYLFMNMGAFAVAILVGNESSYELSAYDGLARRSFWLALLMAFFLLSLAGIPPLAGFMAKFVIFAAAIKGGWYWLAAAAALNSVVSVFYYLRIAYHMFFMPPRTDEPVRAGLFLYSGLAVAAAGVLVIGLYPEPFMAAARISSVILPALGAAPR